MSDERSAWIALAATPGVGDATFERMLLTWGSAAAALDAVARLPTPSADRRLAGVLGQPTRAGLAAAIQSSAADPPRAERQMRALGGWVLTPLDPGYPGTLGAIDTPPLVLFGRGHAEVLAAAPAVAVVGTRSPTPVGRTIAGRVARHLAGAGAVVISGLAIGVDGEAHRATLDAGGRTLAVIGSGPDRPGPAAHRRLAERIVAAGGVVLGELAPGVSATRGTFPRRNRIISGLAGATIVVEAPAQSGALITARHALEQGRKLLVAPGRPFDRRVAGNLALLRETPALPLIGLDELLSDLELENQPPAANVASRDHPIDLGSLGPSERAVAEALREGPGSADQLCQATGRSAAEVAAALMLLQLRGWTRTHGALHLPAGRLLDQARR